MIFTGWCWPEKSPGTRFFSLDFIWLCDRIHNPLWISSNDVVWSVIFSPSASEEFHLCRELSSGSSSFPSFSYSYQLDGHQTRPIRGQSYWSDWRWSAGEVAPLGVSSSCPTVCFIHPESRKKQYKQSLRCTKGFASACSLVLHYLKGQECYLGK